MLLWLGGAALRLTYLAVPPVLPLMQDELGLSATEIGLLSGLPILMLSGAALVGSLLNGFTALMGVGVAAAQPAMATLVRHWLPERVGFGTAVYVNGLLVGEVAPVALTLPLVLPLVDASWRLSLLVWSVPLLVSATLFAASGKAARLAVPSAPQQPPAWWPDWSSSTLWRAGLLFGCANAMYFGANAFIPVYLRQIGETQQLTATLTALNLGQLPASFLLLAVADRIAGRRWPFDVTPVSSST